MRLPGPRMLALLCPLLASAQSPLQPQGAPAVSWRLHDRTACRRECPDGQRHPTQAECYDAVVAAAQRDRGLRVFHRLRVVDEPSLPSGCTYSHASKRATFNLNSAGGGSSSSYQRVCGGEPVVPQLSVDDGPPIPTIVISGASRYTDERTALLQQMGLSPERIEPVYVNETCEGVPKNPNIPYNVAQVGAKGCYLAHVNAWKLIAKRRQKILVLESDWTIGSQGVDEVRRSLRFAYERAEHYVSLGWCNHGGCTTAYFLSVEAAANMTRSQAHIDRHCGPVDALLSGTCRRWMRGHHGELNSPLDVAEGRVWDFSDRGCCYWPGDAHDWPQPGPSWACDFERENCHHGQRGIFQQDKSYESSHYSLTPEGAFTSLRKQDFALSGSCHGTPCPEGSNCPTSPLCTAPSSTTQHLLPRAPPGRRSRDNTGARSLPHLFRRYLLDQSGPICKRCDSYDSFVVLSGQWVAGMSDRVSIMSGAALLATSLCARLIMPSPANALLQLSTGSNGGAPVDPSWGWERYLQLGLLPDGQSVIARPGEELQHITGRATVLKSKYAEVVSTYTHVASLAGQFVWYIDDNYHHWSTQLPPLGCDGDQLTLPGAAEKQHPMNWAEWSLPPSTFVRELACAIRDALGATTDTMHAVHVRRTDPANRCNTSVAAVVEHIKGCDAAWNAPDPWGATLVLFTDETEQVYLDELVAALSELPRWGGRVRHGDRVIMEQLSEQDRADSFLVYSVAADLMATSSRYFELHRCHGTAPCEDSW